MLKINIGKFVLISLPLVSWVIILMLMRFHIYKYFGLNDLNFINVLILFAIEILI